MWTGGIGGGNKEQRARGTNQRERTRRAATVMSQVWGIEKRRFGRDWGRKVWMFDKLMRTVLRYGVESWR